MKRTTTFLISAHLLLTATICNGMNNDSSNNYSPLTSIQKAEDAIYLTNKLIAIRNETGCNIIDRIKDQEDTKIINEKCQYITAHPTEPLLAMAHHKTLTIFNYKTKEKISSTECAGFVNEAIFNPHKPIIFIRYHHYETKDNDRVIEYNYKTNHREGCNLWYYPTAYHPIKEKLAITHDYSEDKKLYMYDYSLNYDNSTNNPGITLNLFPEYCTYNPNGSQLAVRSSDQICLINNITSIPQYLTKLKWHPSWYATVKFHPNSSVLAAVLRKPYAEQKEFILHYYETTQGHIIDEIILPDIKQNYESVHPTISFSPNGKELLFTVYLQHMIFPVSAKVRYPQFPYILFLLKNLKHAQNSDIPDDIIKLIAHTLLEI